MSYTITEFETLYARIFAPSMRLAVSLLHDENEARDVVQEAFLKLWESDLTISNPEAFVIRTVRNACLNSISATETHDRIKRKLSLEPMAEDMDIEQRNQEVRLAVTRLLSSRERQVVDRVYAQGLSYKDTAATLGVSVATVNKNIVSALKKLRNHFKTHKS